VGAEADIEVEKDGEGTPTVTCARYEENPEEGFTNEIGKYYDVSIDNDTGVENITIRFYYTEDDISGIDEDMLQMRWWNGTAWELCDPQTINTTDTNGYSGYIELTINSTSIPNLSQITGTIFAPRASAPSPVGGKVLPTIYTIIPWLALTISALIIALTITIKKYMII